MTSRRAFLGVSAMALGGMLMQTESGAGGTLGFEAGMFAGSVASLTVLGAPDLIVLTLSEFAAQAYRINRAGNLPLMVDADHGYGNALNVMRTVQELETAGVAGMPLWEVVKAAMPWLMVMLSFLIIVTYIPGISLFLPRLLF